MATIFANPVSDAKRTWVEYTDINNDTLKSWNSITQAAGLNKFTNKLTDRIYGDKVGVLLREYDHLIRTCIEQLKSIQQGMYKSIVFMVTTVDGIVIYISAAQNEYLERLDKEDGLGIGTTFTMARTGVNAITAARQLEQWVYLRGTEHDLSLFSQWSCFCSPIRSGEKIVGYLDMSFSSNEDHFTMASIFNLALLGIDDKLSSYCPDTSKEKVVEHLLRYKLAPRELEVAYLWLMNQGALRISHELGITEGTVRNVIKKVYRKTGVSDKGQFIRKFMGSIS